MRNEGKRDYFVGDRYTCADIALFPWAKMLLGRGYDRDG